MYKAVYYELDSKNCYRIFFYDNVYAKIGSITGSYNVLFCRLFGISYVDFLKMIVSRYGASLKGKNSRYVSFWFNDKKNAEEFCNEVNLRWNYVLTKEGEKDNV